MTKSERLARGFALAVVLGGLTVGTAQAQSYTGRFTLPREARWGGAVLPAGDYRLAMDSIKGPLQVIDASGRVRVLAYGIPDSPRADQPTALLVTREGSAWTVRSLNCPVWGHNFVYEPFRRAERELLASGTGVETVPVRMASR